MEKEMQTSEKCMKFNLTGRSSNIKNWKVSECSMINATRK